MEAAYASPSVNGKVATKPNKVVSIFAKMES
jgi:hypothetical protein